MRSVKLSGLVLLTCAFFSSWAAAQEDQDQVVFKSGIVERGRIVEKDAKGFWFEMDGGTAKVYITNGEVEKIEAAAPVPKAPKETKVLPKAPQVTESSADSDASFKACGKADLVGDWKKIVVLRTRAPNNVPMEHFRFDEQGFAQTSASFGQVDEEMVEMTFNSATPSVRYGVTEKGRVTLVFPGIPSAAYMDCRVATAASGSKTYHTGDLRLVRYDQDGKTVIDEIILRKLDPKK